MKQLFSPANTMQLHAFQQLHWEGPYTLQSFSDENCICTLGSYNIHIEAKHIWIEQCYEQFLLITMKQLRKLEVVYDEK